MHCEGGAGAERALNCQPTGMPIEDMLDQCQAQSGAALRSAIGYIHAIEALGETWKVFRRNARPVVTYRNPRFQGSRACLRTRCGAVDPLADSTILQRVFNQIFERADEFVPVSKHHKRSRQQ